MKLKLTNVSMMLNDSAKLKLAQIVTPLFRVFFAFILIPIHPEGTQVLNVFIFSEMLSAITVMGRNTLIASGYKHDYLSRYLDVFLISFSVVILFFVLSTAEQLLLIPSIVVTTVGLWGLNIFSSYCLRHRKYAFLFINIFSSYVIASLSIYANELVAIIFFAIYICSDLLLPRFDTVIKSRFSCGASSMLSLVTQKIDMQLAVLLFGSLISDEIFKLNALFMPLAILVRIFSNTALITGKEQFVIGPKYIFVCSFIGVLYTAAITTILSLFDVEILNDVTSFLIILASVALALFNIPFREKISSFANAGNFTPLLWLSILGFIPFIGLAIMYFFDVQIGMVAFLFTAYLMPRVFMFGYGLFLHTQNKRKVSDKIY
jgi:hypothetical protein